MEFILRYKGPIPADNTRAAGVKENIRREFQRQLVHLVVRDVRFTEAASIHIPTATLSDRSASPERNQDGTIKSYFFKVTHTVDGRAYDFVPLVNRIQDRYVELDMVWLRPEKPGQVLSRGGGDLDNRLKILLDALRMPLNTSEVKRADAPPDERGYCLLEDDSLISKLSVTTHVLLDDLPPGHGGDVELLIRVTIRSGFPQLGNILAGFSD